MPVNNRTISDALLYGLLICGPAYGLPVIAEEQPSLDFLEYLGSEESKVDDKWSSPVDLDIEQYLVDNKSTRNRPATNKPADRPSANSEDSTHE